MNHPWLLRVLWAFRDTMNMDKPDDVPAAIIGWPTPAMTKGPYAPFVWFASDPIVFRDGRELHTGTELVTGVLVFQDPSRTAESELEQAITAYYAMRRNLAAAIEDRDSHFNAQFEGVADPSEDKGGIQPTGAGDFDGTSIIGERWTVVGSAAAIGAGSA